MINVYLVGRLGNQLFTYAMAEALRQRRGGHEKIVCYCDQITNMNWEITLKNYNIPNVEFVHGVKRPLGMTIQSVISSRFRRFFVKHKNLLDTRFYELCQRFLNSVGIVMEMGRYVDMRTPHTRNVLVKGGFQSVRYFEDVQPLIRKNLGVHVAELMQKDYVQKLLNSNSVCISVKVEHNADNPLFDVCSPEYYEEALAYIKEHVENPLFFVCSDNVQYVLNHYVDASKYECICQEKGLPVNDSLAIMGLCKHFVMGNSSFAWWAQYMSENPVKIVVAPNRWLRTSKSQGGGNAYAQNWHYVDVTGYIARTAEKYKNMEWSM